MGRATLSSKLFKSKKKYSTKKKSKRVFTDDRQVDLKLSDIGSWYNQEKQWLDEDENENFIGPSSRKIILPEELY